MRQFLANLAQKHGWNAMDLEIFMEEFAEEAGHRNSEYGIRVRNLFFQKFLIFRNCLLTLRVETMDISVMLTCINIPKKLGET